MTQSLVQGIIDALSGSVGKEAIVFIISMIPILELRGALLVARTASWSAGRESDSIMYSWEYYTGSVYPASDHTDF